MLRSLRELEGFKVGATDGEIGHVVAFLLDDQRWVVRYLVVETGGFLDVRQVLISPISFRQADWSAKRFDLALTVEKIRNSPGVDTDRPVSRQLELDYHRYYGYPYYWGTGLWGMGSYPGLLSAGVLNSEPTETTPANADPHLRSSNEVRGYHVQGSDGAIGHIEDFIVDDESWEVRYLVVDTRNWWFGKKVLVSPTWASSVSFDEQKVFVELSREAIKSCPEWDAAAAVERGYEERLFLHYKRPTYWSGEQTKHENTATRD